MRHIVVLIILVALVGCSNRDCSLSSCLPIIPECEENTSRIYNDYDERVNGESFLLRHFLKPSYIVFDIGANVGTWSKNALAIEPNLTLIAFEPIPEVFARLRKDIGKKAYSLHNIAITDRIGQTPFFFYNQNWFTTKLSGLYKREVTLKKQTVEPITIKVEQDTLDHFCFNKDICEIDLLKIDTEGSEIKILLGAENMIKDQRIRAIQFEYDSPYQDAGTTLKEVVRYLTNNDYVLFKITPKGLIHIGKWTDSLENLSHANYFAIRQNDVPDYSVTENLDTFNAAVWEK